MDSTDLGQVQRRLRLAYELGRLRLALFGVVPLLLIVALATSLTHTPLSALKLGAVMVVAAAAMLWYGRDPQRAVLPGIAAGLVPLVLVLCATRVHACGAGGCSTLCIPACAVGGVVAGLAVASVGRRRRAGVWFWLSASTLALLTGSMGCACIGYAGLIGLGLGFGAGVGPGLGRHWLAAKKS